MPLSAKGAIWPAILFIAIVLGGVLAPSSIDAAAGSQRYASSKTPYWLVGNLNKDLSSFCRKNLFNQIRVLNYNIAFEGEKGRGVTGIAKRGWNLYDPLKLALPNVTYHFRNDRYSNCRVYTAGGNRR